MAIKDGEWELFDYDYATGKSTWHIYDSFGNLMHQRIDTPVDNIIKSNEHFRNDVDQSKADGLGRRIASIPLDILYGSGLSEAHIQGDNKFINNWINDGNNSAFKTHDGTV